MVRNQAWPTWLSKGARFQSISIKSGCLLELPSHCLHLAQTRRLTALRICHHDQGHLGLSSYHSMGHVQGGASGAGVVGVQGERSHKRTVYVSRWRKLWLSGYQDWRTWKETTHSNRYPATQQSAIFFPLKKSHFLYYQLFHQKNL